MCVQILYIYIVMDTYYRYHLDSHGIIFPKAFLSFVEIDHRHLFSSAAEIQKERKKTKRGCTIACVHIYISGLTFTQISLSILLSFNFSHLLLCLAELFSPGRLTEIYLQMSKPTSRRYLINGRTIILYTPLKNLRINERRTAGSR